MRSPGSSCVERQRSDMSPLILATIALTSLMVTIGRGGLSINGSLLMTYPLRPVVALALGLLVTACGGGGSVVPTPPPEAPGSFTAELTPNHEALLRWTAPTPSADRAPVTGYAVYLESAGGVARRLGDTRSFSYLHPGLSPGTRYVFHVRALSDVGPSQRSASAFVDVPLGPSLLPPEAPGSFKAELTPNHEAFLSWTVPTPSADRAPVTGYRVYLQSSGGQISVLGDTPSLSYRHPGLSPSTRYVFFVRALSDVGLSQPSASAFVDVLLGPSLLPPEAPGSFKAELTPNHEAFLSWTAPTPSADRAPVTGYEVYLTSSGGVARRLGDTQSLSYLHPGLLPGTRYVFHVYALSDLGASLASASAFVDVPGVPIVPIAVPHVTVRADEGDQRVLISWSHLAPELPTVVTGFILQYCKVVDINAARHEYRCDADGWMNHPNSPSPPTTRDMTDKFVCNGPDARRMYRMQALAQVRTGSGGSLAMASSRYSEPTRPICPSARYSPPRRVVALFAANPVDNRVNICWDAPFANRSPVTGYELQVTPDDNLPAAEDGWLILDAHVFPSASPVCRLYSGLAGNDQRWFRVRAYNLAGHGHWSAPYHYRHGGAVVPPLSSASTARSPGALTVADARAREGEDAVLVFEVTLGRAASGPVTVDYATADGTAKAGEDYRTASGTLELAAGETSKTVEVAVLDDTKDEGEETFTLRLSNASGAAIADGEATGAIENGDSMPKAWLTRFGRTIAGQVVDAVGARLEGTPGTHVTVGGMSLGSSGAPGVPDALSQRGSEPGWDVWTERSQESRSIAARELLLESSFHLASKGDGPAFAAWGRVATGGFEADVDDVRMDGEVTTAFLGADVEGDRWLAGAALSHSEGDGSFVAGSGMASERGRSEVESTVTGVYPYVRVRLHERVSLWGLAGVGQGELTLTEEDRAPIETDIDMTMGALGVRGTVLSPSEAGGFELAVRSDGLWMRMASDAVRSETVGNLAGSQADASRLRLMVEGARAFALGADRTLTPTFEVGIRHDGGDAETGTGLEVGAGVRYAGEGITIEGAVRTLIAHEENGYEEWGASGSVRFDPGPSGRGLSLTLAPTFGAASSGVERLWSLSDTRWLAGDADFEAGRRLGLEAEVGYGVGVELLRTRGVLTPYTGVSLSDEGARAWRLGARWAVAPDLTLGLEGRARQESGNDTSEQAVTLRGKLRW